MSQPAATYQPHDLERIIRRDFGANAFNEVTAILHCYGKEKWQRETLRVSMACLKLANGDIKALQNYIDDACADYRNVIAWAEYPAYFRAHSEQQKVQAIESDWAQLQNWLHRL